MQARVVESPPTSTVYRVIDKPTAGGLVLAGGAAVFGPQPVQIALFVVALCLVLVGVTLTAYRQVAKR